MQVLQAIQELDSLKPNTFSQQQKIQWLDRLDGFILRSLLSRYPEKKTQAFTPGNPDRELLMEAPFDEGYLHWMEAKIHYYNEEIDRYNGAIRLFRGIFEDYQRKLNEGAMPENPGSFRY